MANILPNNIVIRGKSIVELPRNITKQIQSNSTIRTFRGEKAEIIEFANTLETQGYHVTLTEGPLWTVTATVGTLLTDYSTNLTQTPGAAVDKTDIIDWNKTTMGSWSVGFKAETKDILEVSTIPIVANLKPEVLDALKVWRDNPTNKLVIPAEDLVKKYGLSNIEINKQIEYAGKVQLTIQGGQSQIVVPVLSIKQTILVPIGSQYLASKFIYMDSILSENAFYSNENVPVWVLNLVPSLIIALLVRLGDANKSYEKTSSSVTGDLLNDGVEIGRKYGFVKSVVNLEPSSEQRVSITMEYTYGLHNVDIHGFIP